MCVESPLKHFFAKGGKCLGKQISRSEIVLLPFFTSISFRPLFQYLVFLSFVVCHIFSFRAQRQFQPLYFALYYTPKWVLLSTPSLSQTQPSSLFLFW